MVQLELINCLLRKVFEHEVLKLIWGRIQFDLCLSCIFLSQRADAAHLNTRAGCSKFLHTRLAYSGNELSYVNTNVLK